MPIWNTPYDREDSRNGQEVEVIAEREVPGLQQGDPLLKQYTVSFPDGFVSDAWPEEIGERP